MAEVFVAAAAKGAWDAAKAAGTALTPYLGYIGCVGAGVILLAVYDHRGPLPAPIGWFIKPGAIYQLAQLKAQDAAAIKATTTRNAAVASQVQTVTKTIVVHDQAAQAQIKTLTQTILKEVPVYVTAKADADCPIPNGFVRLLDAGSAGAAPQGIDGALGADAATSDVKLSEVSASVVGNYGTCRATAQTLTDLQTWEAERERIESTPITMPAPAQ